MTKDHSFRQAFLSRIRHDWRVEQEGNFDHYRFPDGMAGRSTWRRYARQLGGERARSVWRTTRTVAHAAKLQWMYDQFADDASRDLMVAVLAFRALGRRHVRLPLNGPRFWGGIQTIERDLLRHRASHHLPSGEVLDDYDLSPSGTPVRLRGNLLNVLNAFTLEQYRFERDGIVVEVAPGDNVIDAGGCWGDTALYFASRTGLNGSVWVYEFEQENLKVFAHNLQINPELAPRIHVMQHPVWSKAGIPLSVTGTGPNTRIAPAKNGQGTVTTDTIDAMIKRSGLGRLDFVKMDIEGAELEALKGAEASIRSNRPKLAISIYHKLEHFWEIARWIDRLGLGYRFYLDHFTIHAEETMLFAVASGG